MLKFEILFVPANTPPPSSSAAGPLGHQQSKLADWGSPGPESTTNGHGPASTLPRMASHSNAEGKRHIIG